MGSRAKKMGNAFEDLFSFHCRRNGIKCVRIPDGCKTIGPNKIIRVKTPFDYFITACGLSACIDTKTIAKGRFNYGLINYDQMRELLETEKSVPSGYLIWFRDVDKVRFFTATELYKLRQGESYTHEEGLHIGNSSSLNPWRILNLNARLPLTGEQLDLINSSNSNQNGSNN